MELHHWLILGCASAAVVVAIVAFIYSAWRQGRQARLHRRLDQIRREAGIPAFEDPDTWELGRTDSVRGDPEHIERIRHIFEAMEEDERRRLREGKWE